MAPPRTVHLAVISTHDTCTITFCASLLKLQVQLARSSDIHTSINFYPCVQDALTDFAKKGHETLVMIHSHLGVPETFYLEEPAYDCVVSPYPLSKIDWDRVARKLADPETTESPQHVGNIYNFDPTRSTPVSARYVKVPREAVTEFGACKLRRGVDFDTVPHVYVDLTQPSVNHGTLDYTGCVGVRKQLR
jgi:hypothetical protein